MNRINSFLRRSNIYAIAFSVILSVASVALGVGAATTISTNITTDGTLTVTGASTHNGNVTLGDAVGDSVTANAYFTQLRIGTGSTFGNIGTVGDDELGVEGAVEIDGIAYLDGGFIAAASSTASAAFSVHGTLSASSTLQVDGVSNLFGTTTIITLDNTASSSPSQEFNLRGDAFLTNVATTSLIFDATGSNTGGCIQMQGTDGGVYRIYIAATSSASVDFRSLVVESGVCK